MTKQCPKCGVLCNSDLQKDDCPHHYYPTRRTKEIKSMDEFYAKYLPEYDKKYPITMRVSKEEQAFILYNRIIQSVTHRLVVEQ